MSPQEGMSTPEQAYQEAQREALETNRLLIEHLPADGSALALQLAPGVFHFDTMNGVNYEMLRFQVDKLLEGGSNLIADIISGEATYEDGSKATGTTQVYKMPFMDENGAGEAYLAVNMGARANNGNLTLTASREHPMELEKRAKQAEAAARRSPASWLLRRLSK